MSDAFKCEICDSFYSRDKRGSNQSAKPRIKNKTVDVHFTARMSSGVCTPDICLGCAITVYSRAVKSLGRKRGA